MIPSGLRHPGSEKDIPRRDLILLIRDAGSFEQRSNRSLEKTNPVLGLQECEEEVIQLWIVGLAGSMLLSF